MTTTTAPVTLTYPRQFVPQALDVSKWDEIQPLADALRSRDIRSSSDLERWLLDFSEFHSVIDEFGSRLYIEKSCHTDSDEIQKRFMHYVEAIEPRMKPVVDELQRKFLQSPFQIELTSRDQRFAMLARQWQAEVDIFRNENVLLETEVTKIVNEYDKLSAAMTAVFRGKEYTMQQLARFGEEPDRPTREAAWRVQADRRLEDRQSIEALFEKVLPLREKIAKNAGLSNYRDYVWKSYKRFDYSPDDCLHFAETVATCCVPLVDKLDRARAADLKLDRLRPWDLSVNPHNRPPLRPFEETDIDGFVKKTTDMFNRLSLQLGDEFDSLRRNRNLDLASRKGKQPGGYQSTLNESRQPFIFMNAAGLQRDVETLLHEGGHAFHAIAARDEPLVFLRHAPMEFCEVASMSMELLGTEHLDLFYDNANDRARAKRQHFEGIIRILPWIATIDLFQHWLYTHPNHSRVERTDEWLRLMKIYFSKVDFTGLEDALAAWWQRQLHLFHAPFYYIEYGIAQLGALQIWLKAKQDPRQALANYRAGLALGGARPLPQLFAAAGIKFDFSAKTLKPLMKAVEEELDTLPK